MRKVCGLSYNLGNKSEVNSERRHRDVTNEILNHQRHENIEDDQCKRILGWVSVAINGGFAMMQNALRWSTLSDDYSYVKREGYDWLDIHGQDILSERIYDQSCDADCSSLLLCS